MHKMQHKMLHKRADHKINDIISNSSKRIWSVTKWNTTFIPIWSGLLSDWRWLILRLLNIHLIAAVKVHPQVFPDAHLQLPPGCERLFAPTQVFGVEAGTVGVFTNGRGDVALMGGVSGDSNRPAKM